MVMYVRVKNIIYYGKGSTTILCGVCILCTCMWPGGCQMNVCMIESTLYHRVNLVWGQLQHTNCWLITYQTWRESQTASACWWSLWSWQSGVCSQPVWKKRNTTTEEAHLLCASILQSLFALSWPYTRFYVAETCKELDRTKGTKRISKVWRVNLDFTLSIERKKTNFDLFVCIIPLSVRSNLPSGLWWAWPAPPVTVESSQPATLLLSTSELWW